ncbi:hypothetical protein L209DRAFT_596527 [Thermothelomyces heterothallicus CBS 203.75]
MGQEQAATKIPFPGDDRPHSSEPRVPRAHNHQPCVAPVALCNRRSNATSPRCPSRIGASARCVNMWRSSPKETGTEAVKVSFARCLLQKAAHFWVLAGVQESLSSLLRWRPATSSHPKASCGSPRSPEPTEHGWIANRRCRKVWDKENTNTRPAPFPFPPRAFMRAHQPDAAPASRTLSSKDAGQRKKNFTVASLERQHLFREELACIAKGPLG